MIRILIFLVFVAMLASGFAWLADRPGDMVVCLGAGTISAWANNLPERLQEKAA